MVTKSQVSTLQFSADGSPWCKIAAKPGINLDTLEYSLDGSPWYGVEEAVTSSGLKWNSTSESSIKTIDSILLVGVKSINGVLL